MTVSTRYIREINFIIKYIHYQDQIRIWMSEEGQQLSFGMRFQLVNAFILGLKVVAIS